MLLQLAVGLRAALVRAGEPGLGLDGEPGVLHTLPILLLLVIAVGNITAKISSNDNNFDMFNILPVTFDLIFQ